MRGTPSSQLVPRPSPQAAAAALRSVLPDVDWLLGRCLGNGEWLRFPPEFVAILERLKIEKYAPLYLNASHIPRFVMPLFFDDEELRELDQRALDGGEAAVRELLDETINQAVASEDCWLIPKTEAEKKAASELWMSLSEDQQKEAMRDGQIVWTAFLATFYNYLSSLVHRVPLTTLVQAGVNGDDDALVRAIQIDRTILTDLPYAVERFKRASRECDWIFLDKLAYRIGNPLLRGKIRFRQLWLALAMLDVMNLLDGTLTHNEILNVLNDAGLNRYDNRIEAVGYLSKRIAEFREFQTRARNLPSKSFLRRLPES